MSLEEQRRDRFEEWVSERLGWSEDDLRRDRNGDYFWLEARERFDTWNAAIDSIEIELPDATGFDVPSFAAPAIAECREAIEAAGLKVKP